MQRPGRPERRLDPEADPIQALASDLRKLRQSVGTPTYDRLAELTENGSQSRGAKSLSAAANGLRCPSWDTLEAYVLGCGGKPAEWRDRWDRARQWRPQQVDADPTDEPKAQGPEQGDVTPTAVTDTSLVPDAEAPQGATSFPGGDLSTGPETATSLPPAAIPDATSAEGEAQSSGADEPAVINSSAPVTTSKSRKLLTALEN